MFPVVNSPTPSRSGTDSAATLPPSGGRGGGGGGGGGSSSTGLIIALICGQRDVQTFTSSGEQFQVEFRSTSDFQDQGFAASFEFLRKIRSPDVSVKTPTTTTTTTTMSTTTTKKQQHWNDELRRSKLGMTQYYMCAHTFVGRMNHLKDDNCFAHTSWRSKLIRHDSICSHTLHEGTN